MPTLGEVVEIARGRAGLIPETKAPEVYGALGYSMERLLLAELEAQGLAGGGDPSTPIIVQSFPAASLQVLRHELGSDLPSTFLIAGEGSQGWLTPAGLDSIRGFATGIGPTKRHLLEVPEAVEHAHERGLIVIPWTFRVRDAGRFGSVELEMAHFVFALGVDGLFTDNPDLFPRTRPAEPVSSASARAEARLVRQS